MTDHPRLRPELQQIPIEHQGVPLVLWSDPHDLAEPYVSDVLQYLMMVLLDGTRDRDAVLRDLPQAAREVASEAVARAIATIPAAAVLTGLIDTLDRRLLLQNARTTEALRARREAFLAADVRPARHAGTAYPAEADELRQALDAMFAAGPGAVPELAGDDGAPVAILAPHIDLRAGGPTFAHAYAALAAGPPPARVVILGISHFAEVDAPFTLTRKAFETPLGAVPTDGAYLDLLPDDASHFADEFAHAREHSIEFQVLFLQHLYGDAVPPIVPVLCGGMFQHVLDGTVPTSDPDVAAFIEALRAADAALPGHTAYVASVDFSHVGPKFGDQRTADDAFLREVAGVDRCLIGAVEAGDADVFWERISERDNATHVCGYPAIYTMLRALGPGKGELLHYMASREEQTRSAVSFAAVSYRYARESVTAQ